MALLDAIPENPKSLIYLSLQGGEREIGFSGISDSGSNITGIQQKLYYCSFS
jgi:hypothetical protein